jgi:hypothetical protein
MPASNTTVVPREGGYPVRRGVEIELRLQGLLDHPLEPVIGRSEATTRWRMMAALLDLYAPL